VTVLVYSYIWWIVSARVFISVAYYLPNYYLVLFCMKQVMVFLLFDCGIYSLYWFFWMKFNFIFHPIHQKNINEILDVRSWNSSTTSMFHPEFIFRFLFNTMQASIIFIWWCLHKLHFSTTFLIKMMMFFFWEQKLTIGWHCTYTTSYAITYSKFGNMQVHILGV